ncbi:MotA/TolQ/ExbB proton channel family protein [Plastoroseomonas arctica]|uniref:Flagellar motor protein MotA n=1 Tax=Plastoroseomonas arctica TaxID=1509237 RepID=A0AAF1JZY8_9PROT|nr:MotA/TolQ/ExbB proton channel family protein [Plastoroseomonas arctica]MBR0657280.1 flagellar motor protein MotA [Plastoroseomonas arctica]
MQPAIPPDLSILSLVLHADPVVKGVLVLLVLASIACWAVIIDKSLRIGALRRDARGIVAASPPMAPPQGETLAAETLRAGLAEWAEGRDADESRADFHRRLEQVMRAAIAARLRAAENGLSLLATVGAVAPFIGLFGTVWGIMNSFSGIAASNDTSLAVVAPGIAEALFATAIGLVAAIPAVVAYNRLSGGFGRLRAEAMAAAGQVANRLARGNGERRLRAAAE